MLTKSKYEEYNAPRLCGGTFFTLLLRATKQGLNGRKSFGVRLNFTESDVLEGLIQIVCPNYKRPVDTANFKSAVSPFKSCNTSKSGRLPITEAAEVSTFNSAITDYYKAVASPMNVFLDCYIESTKAEWLVKALLALIESDTSIKNIDEFYINQDGSKVSKMNMLCLAQVCLPTFLLGIWHFIIIKRQDNGVGKNTYNGWHTQGRSKNAKKTFTSKIGETITRKITLVPFSNDSAETVEAKIIPDAQEEFSASQDEASTTDSGATSQSIHTSELKYQQNSLVVNMGGSNNSIGNIIMSQTIIKGKEDA